MSDLLSQYQEVVQTPPAAGDILITVDGSPVVLTIQVEKDKPPFIYGRAYFNEVLGDTLGWYLRGVGDDRSIGWKCVLMTKARREALKNCKIEEDKITVKSLKVVRKSGTGNSLLCEVHEYLPKVEEAETPKEEAETPKAPAETPKIQVIEPKILVAVVNEKLETPDEEPAF